MAQFLGGPYDGQDFPVAEGLVEVRLPEPDELAAYDPVTTSQLAWPHIYRKARFGPVFRYTSEEDLLPPPA